MGDDDNVDSNVAGKEPTGLSSMVLKKLVWKQHCGTGGQRTAPAHATAVGDRDDTTAWRGLGRG